MASAALIKLVLAVQCPAVLGEQPANGWYRLSDSDESFQVSIPRGHQERVQATKQPDVKSIHLWSSDNWNEEFRLIFLVDGDIDTTDYVYVNSGVGYRQVFRKTWNGRLSLHEFFVPSRVVAEKLASSLDVTPLYRTRPPSFTSSCLAGDARPDHTSLSLKIKNCGESQVFFPTGGGLWIYTAYSNRSPFWITAVRMSDRQLLQRKRSAGAFTGEVIGVNNPLSRDTSYTSISPLEIKEFSVRLDHWFELEPGTHLIRGALKLLIVFPTSPEHVIRFKDSPELSRFVVWEELVAFETDVYIKR